MVGDGTLTVTFLQSGKTLSGTWATTFTDPSYNDSGSLSGAVDGAQVAATLTPSDPTSCPYNVAGTFSGAAINGTFAAFDCTVSASGSFEVEKQ